MTKNRLVVVVVIALAWCKSPIHTADITPGIGGFNTAIVPFFDVYCIRCHGPEKSKAKVTVHTLEGDLIASRQLDRWEKILDVIRSGEMPPEDERQPEATQRQAVVRWIESGLKANVATASAEVGEPTMRRLTNIEYENTLRDLLGFKLNVIDRLPEDPLKPYHFNNTAGLMRVGPEQIDRYLEVARHAMASAIVDPGKPTVFTTKQTWSTISSDTGMGQDEVGIDGNRRNTAATGMGLKGFPLHGEFRVRFQAAAILPKGFSQASLRLVMGYPLDRNSGNLQVSPIGIVRLSNGPDDLQQFEFRGRIENFPAEKLPNKDGRPQPDRLHITPQLIFDNGTLNDDNTFANSRALGLPRVVLNSLEFEAPLTETWPPPHHRRILFDSPLRDRDPAAYMREVLLRFMSRAFRRPPTIIEVDHFARVFSLIRPDFDTFEAAARETLAMVLIAPQFLFHAATADDAPDRSSTRQHEIASRLSYFLWASMPDELLSSLASQGKLGDPQVLAAQAARMLADERSTDFIANFTTQWLSLTKMKTVPINRDLFPRFLYRVAHGERAGTETPYLPTVRDYMIEETIGFIAELVRRNASVLQIVDSDFVYINQRLAVHYGVPGVEGDQLRPVPVTPELNLGGLLTQGSVLIGNGTGSAPHPIYRAVWLREAILGDVVAPPPAEVPALADSAGESAEKALTIADLLAKHRQVESCNDCHARLDPWGIPFEHYNAIGLYQPKVPKEGTRVAGFMMKQHENLDGYRAYLASINTQPISAEARLPQGPRVDGMRDLKRFLLTERKRDIAENVIRRLLTYALGRELTYRDRFAVNHLCDVAEKNDYRFRDMIVSVCTSDLLRASPSHQRVKQP